MINEELLKVGMKNIKFITKNEIIEINRITKIDGNIVYYTKSLPFFQRKYMELRERNYL